MSVFNMNFNEEIDK